MKTIRVSECFRSLQGEGAWIGAPSIFLRVFGCNFNCSGFGMPKGTNSVERKLIDVSKYSDYKSLPLVHTGCDSYPSWDPRFKDFSPKMTVDEIYDSIKTLLPGGKWNGTHLVITGGEPLLGYQSQYPELIEKLAGDGLECVTFETNGTKSLSENLHDYIHESCFYINYTFSVSPKLSNSGHTHEEAIKPEVIDQYSHCAYTYLKFVVADPSDIDEIKTVVKVYKEHGFEGPVYLMPCGGTGLLYNENNRMVADLALKNNYFYSPRLQVELYKNAWGT